MNVGTGGSQEIFSSATEPMKANEAPEHLRGQYRIVASMVLNWCFRERTSTEELSRVEVSRMHRELTELFAPMRRETLLGTLEELRTQKGALQPSFRDSFRKLFRLKPDPVVTVVDFASAQAFIEDLLRRKSPNSEKQRIESAEQQPVYGIADALSDLEVLASRAFDRHPSWNRGVDDAGLSMMTGNLDGYLEDRCMEDNAARASRIRSLPPEEFEALRRQLLHEQDTALAATKSGSLRLLKKLWSLLSPHKSVLMLEKLEEIENPAV